MNARYVVDSWAWYEYFEGSAAGFRIRPYVEEGSASLYTSAISVAELVSKFLRSRREPQPLVSAITSLSAIVAADLAIASSAGRIHSDLRKIYADAGLADAFVVATARRVGAKVLTGDPHFSKIKDVILI